MNEVNQKLQQDFPWICEKWDQDIIPVLKQYIAIPNKSVIFDADWKAHGYMDEAMQLFIEWAKQQPIEGLSLELFEEPGRTPLLLVDIPGQSEHSVLLYGHMDKQPEMRGWDEDLGPWKPVLRDGKLYGRGGADDGYALFATLTAIASLQRQGIPHARCVVLIEASEESGSVDLPFYLEKLQDRLKAPNFVICLDSGCGNYEQLWGTTSLRGIIGGELTIQILTEGIHSGIGSGVVPSSFLILRQLLDRIENSANGQIQIDALQCDIPDFRAQQAQLAADILGDGFIQAMPLKSHAKPLDADVSQLILNRTWRPALSVTGVDGLPATQDAGNVTLPELTVKLSMRTPPTCDVNAAMAQLKETLEANPPYQAKVSFHGADMGPGWHAPQLEPWLKTANDAASQCFYGKPAAYIGEGGSIPFMGILGEMFPQAQFLITGVLGPHSNAHGPNEFLHIDMVKKVTGCVASVLAAHYIQHS